MSLQKILNELKKLNITGISDDTRYLQAGELFVVRKGQQHSGEDFIPEAIKLGARAVLAEAHHDLDVPVLVSKKLKKSFRNSSSAFMIIPITNCA